MIHPAFEKFEQLAEKGNLIPIYRELLMDLETPLSFFKRLERNEYAFLLESVEGSERWARYSFLGTRPYLVFKSRGKEVEIVENGGKREFAADEPLRVLEGLLREYRPVAVDGVPPFFGGALGYVSYDAVEQFHDIDNAKKDPLGMPEIFFIFVQTLVAFDNLKHTIKVIDNVRLNGRANLRQAYDAAMRRIAGLVSSLEKRARKTEARELIDKGRETKFHSNLTPQAFKAAVGKAKDYIQAGDIIQVVLCQRLETRTQADPFEIYRALRFINPSPYMYYLELEGLRVIGSSPETMVRLTGDTIELRPIAGTRRRGANPAEEQTLEADLLADPKERAEHIMLVDLGRNDVGRVAEIGTVEVNELMAIERYSHVIHLVSNVRGKLASGKSPFDLFVSSFPAGTVSGAPKIRAMQIISELEPEKRGLYAGAIGYFSFNGNFDTCIVIRTIVMHGKKAFINAGAGIVADSDPEKEYQETLSKARAMLKAIELAEQWRKKS
ncbi:MAG: anthranilate synthase component I [Deltaproteobacteria bacterium RIFCSPLOWO2_12_FULL_60_19]|nr:MAG: anthranilate synthase component I [Deltaproteobacteria bacterium RIFCSPLOWO2_12_FULL_60_19]